LESGELGPAIRRLGLADDRFGTDDPLRLYGRSIVPIHPVEKGKEISQQTLKLQRQPTTDLGKP
jgi:hypothetical protein